jgi:hypothetical protein
VSETLAPELPRIKEPHQLAALLGRVKAQYAPHGLRSLTVQSDAKQPGALAIEAVASPGSKVGTLQAERYVDLRDIQFRRGTTIQGFINDVPLGVHHATSEKNIEGHAESWLLTQLTSDFMKYASRSIENRVVAKITRSPCPVCAVRLATRMRQLRALGYQVTLEIQALSLYKGAEMKGAGSLIAISDLREHGVEVTAWDITKDAARTFGPDVDEEELQRVADRIKPRVEELRRWLAGWEKAGA